MSNITDRPESKKRMLLSAFVIGGLLVASLVSIGIINLYYGGETSSLEAVVVDSDGVEYHFPLDRPGTHTITTSLGMNVIEISEGTARVSEADCANQICVHTGPIHEPGEMIVCLPHELIVTIHDTSSETDNPSDIDTLAS